MENNELLEFDEVKGVDDYLEGHGRRFSVSWSLRVWGKDRLVKEVGLDGCVPRPRDYKLKTWGPRRGGEG